MQFNYNIQDIRDSQMDREPRFQDDKNIDGDELRLHPPCVTHHHLCNFECHWFNKPDLFHVVLATGRQLNLAFDNS